MRIPTFLRKHFISLEQFIVGCAAVALHGCVGVAIPSDQVKLEVVGPPIDAIKTGQGFLYKVPRSTEGKDDGGVLVQSWSMLGREDRGAASGSAEYALAECETISGSPLRWDKVIESIAKRAENHRIVIINESHSVTRHRETMRRLLRRLKPLGFSVFAVETFDNPAEGNPPVDEHANLTWPDQNDGFYTREPIFGRMIREAKALKYRLAAYEQILDPSAIKSYAASERIASRESEQARHLAAILRAMRSDERLLVYVGYSHAKENPDVTPAGRKIEWMAARLKVMTGIDPLTVAQTICRQGDANTFLAKPPKNMTAGLFDVIVSNPLESFVDHRPRWRREAGDIPTAIPPSLRATNEPLIIEAFAWGEPFNAIPVDRVFVEPGEHVPLLLPPGRYRVRAVRTAK